MVDKERKSRIKIWEVSEENVIIKTGGCRKDDFKLRESSK